MFPLNEKPCLLKRSPNLAGRGLAGQGWARRGRARQGKVLKSRNNFITNKGSNQEAVGKGMP
jgi:hypothetical protein